MNISRFREVLHSATTLELPFLRSRDPTNPIIGHAQQAFDFRDGGLDY